MMLEEDFIAPHMESSIPLFSTKTKSSLRTWRPFLTKISAKTKTNTKIEPETGNYYNVTTNALHNYFGSNYNHDKEGIILCSDL